MHINWELWSWFMKHIQLKRRPTQKNAFVEEASKLKNNIFVDEFIIINSRMKCRYCRAKGAHPGKCEHNCLALNKIQLRLICVQIVNGTIFFFENVYYSAVFFFFCASFWIVQRMGNDGENKKKKGCTEMALCQAQLTRLYIFAGIRRV